MLKICKKCSVEKDITEYFEFTHQNGRKYRKSICKKCFQADAKKYIKKWESKEETKQYKREYRKKYLQTEKGKLYKQGQARRNLEKSPEKRIFSRSKRRAKLLNIPFNIELTDIIIPKYCPILEIPIFIGTKDNYKNSPSIDKIDPNKGYIKGNIRIISMLANTMKNSADRELLEKFSKNILNYINSNDIVRPIENKESIESIDKEL